MHQFTFYVHAVDPHISEAYIREMRIVDRFSDSEFGETLFPLS